MSHLLCLASERTYVQLGEAEGTETVSFTIILILTLFMLMLGVLPTKTSPDHHLRSHICGLQSVFGLVL